MNTILLQQDVREFWRPRDEQTPNPLLLIYWCLPGIQHPLLAATDFNMSMTGDTVPFFDRLIEGRSRHFGCTQLDLLSSCAK